jgi:dipeptidyl aminopeptidase/acylaminoacyl peptidase
VPANYGHDHYQLMYELEFGLPWENRERWAASSPFWKVEAITPPTLWMGGEVDWNVPIINSKQMYIAMKRLGRETQLVVYPDEHHGIRRPSFIRDRLERWLDWFDTHLKTGMPDM